MLSILEKLVFFKKCFEWTTSRNWKVETCDCLWNFPFFGLFVLLYLSSFSRRRSICWPSQPFFILHSEKEALCCYKTIPSLKATLFLWLINSMSYHICLYKEASHTQAHYYQSGFPHPSFLHTLHFLSLSLNHWLCKSHETQDSCCHSYNSITAHKFIMISFLICLCSIIYIKFIYLLLYFCIYCGCGYLTCMCVYVKHARLVPAVRRKHQIFWNWINKWFWAVPYRCWDLNTDAEIWRWGLGENSKCSKRVSSAYSLSFLFLLWYF